MCVSVCVTCILNHSLICRPTTDTHTHTHTHSLPRCGRALSDPRVSTNNVGQHTATGREGSEEGRKEGSTEERGRKGRGGGEHNLPKEIEEE